MTSLFAVGLVLLGACSDSPVTPGPVDPVAAPVAVVQLSALRTAVIIGDTLRLTATLKDSTGATIVRPVIWESSQTTIATVSPTGLVTTVGTGTARITARSEGKSAHLDITVTPVPPAAVRSVVIRPSMVLLNQNESQPLTLEVKDSLGNVLEGRVATWTSFDATVATVNAIGVVTAVGEGQATVAVDVEGKTAQAIVQVRPPAVARVVLSVETQSLEIGDDLWPSAHAEAQDGQELYGRHITFTTSNDQVADLTANGKIIALRTGTARIRAYCEGQFSEVLITVTEGPTSALLFHRATDAGIEIFLRAVDGTVTRLNAGTVSRHPSPSPDGQRFVFAVVQINPTNGQLMHDLYMVNRDGLNMRHLTQLPGVETDPVWSPDGTKIAFAGAETISGMHDIYVMNVDGTGIVNLTADMPWSHESAPAWSPDSKTLAFASLQGINGGQLYTINIDGTNKKNIAAGNGGAVRHPTWSPDGARIAFSRAFSGVGMDIVIIPRDGGEQTRIVRNGDQVDVEWSPDGQFFAFSELQLNMWHLMTMRIDGTSARVRSLGGAPAWTRP